MKLFSSAFVALAIRGLSTGFGFLVTFLIAHKLGTAANGQYALVTQTVMIMSVIAVAGTDISLIKYLTVDFGEQRVFTRRIFAKITIFVISVSFGLGVMLWLSSPLVWTRWFGDIVPISWLWAMMLMLIGRAGGRLASAMLRSQHSFIYSQILEVLVVPCAVAACIFIGYAKDIEEVVHVNVAVSLVAFVAALLPVWAKVKGGGGREDVAVRSIVRSGLPLLGVGLTQNFTEWFAIVLSAALLGAAQTGVLRIALQISMVLAIIPLGLWSVFTPKLAAAYNKRDMQKVALISRQAVIAIGCVTLPLGLTVIVFVKPLLYFISPDAVSVTSVAVVLVIGQIVSSMMSCMGMLLAMTGHEKVSFRNAILGTIVMIISGNIFVQLYGLMGLAIAILCTITWRQVSCMVAVVRLLRLNPYTGKLYND